MQCEIELCETHLEVKPAHGQLADPRRHGREDLQEDLKNRVAARIAIRPESFHHGLKRHVTVRERIECGVLASAQQLDERGIA